ncbi:MAG: SAM-dependent methyltransferase, partial [Pseudomonadota bacterium]
MPEGLIEHVADTAFLIAHCRALESARPDGLFRDPLAGRLAGDRGKAIAEAFPTPRMTGWMVAIRTYVIDELIRDALARGVDTVVNLGAGLDTRPYRLDVAPALRWLEVDLPEVIAFKEQHLRTEAPRCDLRRVGLDLADLAGRRDLFASLAASAGRLLILTEGVVPYLAEEAVGALADDLRGLSGVDSWIVDYVSPESHAYRQRAGVTEHMKQTPFKFRPADWFRFFADHGWRIRSMRYLPEEGSRLGRPAPLPWRA